jgi:hypothetical protein
MNIPTIEQMLFKQINKPNHFLMMKAINVYGNRYRINVYCEKEEDMLTKKRICASYFCHLNDDLQIISGNPMPSGSTV